MLCLSSSESRIKEPAPGGHALGRLGRHFPTFLGAAAARLGTDAAVVGRVLGALDGAGFACLGADAADGGGQRRTPAHENGSGPAQLGAVPAGSDAVGHLGMGDAGVAALLTRPGAGHARLDAILERLVVHDFPFSF